MMTSLKPCDPRAYIPQIAKENSLNDSLSEILSAFASGDEGRIARLSQSGYLEALCVQNALLSKFVQRHMDLAGSSVPVVELHQVLGVMASLNAFIATSACCINIAAGNREADDEG